MSLKDRALSVQKASKEEKIGMMERAKRAFAEEARGEFSNVFDTPMDGIVGEPSSLIKAKLTVEGSMEFIADRIPAELEVAYGGRGVRFTLIRQCEECGKVYSRKEVNNIEELGEILAHPGKHRCGGGDVATPGNKKRGRPRKAV